MGLSPKSRAGALYPSEPSPPSVVAPQGGLDAGTVRATWAVLQDVPPLALGAMALLPPPRSRHPDRLDHGPVHRA